jgi:hypothetical protein
VCRIDEKGVDVKIEENYKDTWHVMRIPHH